MKTGTGFRRLVALAGSVGLIAVAAACTPALTQPEQADTDMEGDAPDQPSDVDPADDTGQKEGDTGEQVDDVDDRDRCGRTPSDRYPALLIVSDGLRPDYVTQDLMPNVYALAQDGVWGERSYAALPALTRVNAPTISTGSYPRRHGMVGNRLYIPEVSDQPFSNGGASNLRMLDEETDGEMITNRSIGEILDEAGLEYFVTGSGGSGNSLLQNPRESGRGIWVANSNGFFVPAEQRDEAIAIIGPIDPDTTQRTKWAAQSLIHHTTERDPPDVTVMWINETDARGHEFGVGAPETLGAASHVDEQIGLVLDALEAAGHQFNIFLTSDHGFTTNAGGFSAGRILQDTGLDEGVVAVSSSLYLDESAQQNLEAIVEAFRADETVGTIYTRPGPDGAVVPGTFSLELIGLDHERGPDLHVMPAWSDEENEFGHAGITTRGGSNVATHGIDSPYDLRIPFVAAGPDIKEGLTLTNPTGNVDFAPTLLYLQGLSPPEEMDGRVLCEILTDGPEPESIHVHAQTHETTASLGGGLRYTSQLDILQVSKTFYIAGARTVRE